jgi:gas vesicle protein
MKKKNRSSFMLLAGIFVGAAAVYFLKSEPGKELVEQAKKKGQEIKTKIEDKSGNLIETGKDMLASVVETSEMVAIDAAEKVGTIGDELKDSMEDSLNDSQKGIEKAKQEIKKA